ncbi:hypothetical protein ABBQ38_001337 [Trebouxia sp. C0009 RCD-2024]
MQISARSRLPTGTPAYVSRQPPRYAGCRTCAQQQQKLQLVRPKSPFKRTRQATPESQQLPAQHPPATVLSASHSRGEANFIESFQQPHLSKGQRMRLQQWTLQAVSSGAYSLSALLLAGALNPALAVGEFNPGAGAAVTASTPPSIPNLAAPGGLTAFEGLLIFAPVILYGLFTVYRSKVNERAKLSDFLFIAAAGVVVANLVSIIFFKRRLY